MKINIPVLIIVLIISGTQISCKKKNETLSGKSGTQTISNLTSFDSLKFSNVHYYYASTLNNVRISLNYAITYNSDNTVNTINMADELNQGDPGLGWQKNSFEYSGGNYTIYHSDSPGVFSLFSVRTNSEGMVLSYSNFSDSFTASYNGTEILSYNKWYEPSNSKYVWSNGDASCGIYTDVYPIPPNYYTFDTAYDTTYFSYDNTKRGQLGDIFQISDFLIYGRSSLRTLDLPVRQGLNYTFDSIGRITVLTEIDSSINDFDTTIYTYQYL